ncbi:hypothetical protein [Desulfosporosinus fructosivorans]
MQNKLCGYIVDVSGHGVATALQTATFKMMLDNVLLNGKKMCTGLYQRIPGAECAKPRTHAGGCNQRSFE